MFSITIIQAPKGTESEIGVIKKRIQDKLHEEIGILVDAPTQGSGNTNNGNTARRFFENVNIFSRVTGKKSSDS